MGSLRINYTSQLIAESAFDLAIRNEISAFKSNKDVIFESEEALGRFIKMIDVTQESREHLGDLHDNLPESMEVILEANVADAIDDLKFELKPDSDVATVVQSIARDYGIKPEDLVAAFERATKGSIATWAKKDSDSRQARKDAEAADAAEKAELLQKMKDAKKADRMARRTTIKPSTKAMELVQYVVAHIGDTFPDGDPHDVLDRALRDNGISWDEFHNKYERLYNKLFKKETGYKDAWDYSAGLFSDIYPDEPNPYNESVEEGVNNLIKLAGVTSVVLESSGTPLVHSTRSVVNSINESTNNALRAYMVGFAKRKQASLMEAASDLDLDSVVRRYANTVLTNPTASYDRVLEAVAFRLTCGDTRVIREHIGTLTGLSLEDFVSVISERKWAGNSITKNIMESLMESTESNWTIDCPDRGEAFKRSVRGL